MAARFCNERGADLACGTVVFLSSSRGRPRFCGRNPGPSDSAFDDKSRWVSDRRCAASGMTNKSQIPLRREGQISMIIKLRALALTLLLLAGGIAAARASVTLELRGVGPQGFQLAQDDATTSVQMIAPGVLHVHYMPMGRKTPPSLVIDPRYTPDTAFKPEVSRQGNAVTLRSTRMVANWNPKTASLIVSDAQGHVLLRQTKLMALSEERIVLEHAAGDALYGIGGFEANKPVTGLLRRGRQIAAARKKGHAGAPFVGSNRGYGVLVDCNGADFDLAKGGISVDHFERSDADYYIL